MDWQDRLQRPRGYNDIGHAHELTFSCRSRYPFLARERACSWLKEAIDSARRDLGYSLWAYVFMPDHVHLIVHSQQPIYDISHFLKRIKEPVSRSAIAFLRRNAPEWLERLRETRRGRVEHHFWQPGRGFDRNVITTGTLQRMIDYVHLNPVRKKFVEHPAEWKWSSAGWQANCPQNDLQPDPIPPDWLEEAS